MAYKLDIPLTGYFEMLLWMKLLSSFFGTSTYNKSCWCHSKILLFRLKNVDVGQFISLHVYTLSTQVRVGWCRKSRNSVS